MPNERVSLLRSRLRRPVYILRRDGARRMDCRTTGKKEEERQVKLWVDDVRPAPPGYQWVKSVDAALWYIRKHNKINAVTYSFFKIELLDLDHDAGDYASKGGDYIEILKWMELHNIDDIPIHLHTMNSVGRENMRRIILHNGWKQVY